MSHLQAGDKAPAFKGLDKDGQKVSLADFKGKTLVLYFYPQDNTPGCTSQACNLRDNLASLTARGIAVVGVSPDDAASHQKFTTTYSLGFPLLADTQHQVIEAYGVWGEKQMYGRKYMGLLRTTFVIDGKGVIRHIFHKPKVKEHAQEILSALEG
ncbi:MAG: thioredoxin-dependent thiol peroxidase [Bacteroidetes bacterium]|nr:thioredoxin-dependent thiol peroxidase [Bacteroidota bacterium]